MRRVKREIHDRSNNLRDPDHCQKELFMISRLHPRKRSSKPPENMMTHLTATLTTTINSHPMVTLTTTPMTILLLKMTQFLTTYPWKDRNWIEDSRKDAKYLRNNTSRNLTRKCFTENSLIIQQSNGLRSFAQQPGTPSCEPFVRRDKPRDVVR